MPKLSLRFCIIGMKKYIFIYFILIAICFSSILTLIFYKWSELDAKLDCFKKQYFEKSITSPTPINTELRSDINKPHTSSYIQPQTINIRDARLKILQQKLERITNMMKNPDNVNKLPPGEVFSTEPNSNIHIFYYSWFGNPEYDGHWRHWNHQYLPNWKKEDKKVYPVGTHRPPLDISSNYYPALGCYSSKDPHIINTHMKQLADANVGVVIVSWYPPGMSDHEGDPPDKLFPILLDAAQIFNLKVAPHIEPYKDRNPINFSEHIKYLIEKYGSHPALYRMSKNGKQLPVYYVYDSYLTPAAAWRELLSPKGNLSIRGTNFDGIFLGLLVEMQHRYEIKKSHFDGFYTYFATNGFTYGSTWKNWRSLAKFAHQSGLLFVPCVGPGYVDTQIRPWNVGNTRHRRHGKYFEVAWRSALSVGAKVIAITSFNEWHEGTQIEPAIPHSNPITGYTYLDYEPEGSLYYLNLTWWWVNEFTKKQLQS